MRPRTRTTGAAGPSAVRRHRSSSAEPSSRRSSTLATEAPYAADKPVTLYSGNPRSGATMTVPGKSDAAGTGNPHGRNTSFTCSKFAISSNELGRR